MSSTDDKSRPETTIPPGASSTPKMSERTLRNTLEGIEKAQLAQRDIESKRAGASSTRAKLLGAFGGLLTAAAIGGFVWVWDAQTTNALQDAAIQQVQLDARNHDAPPPGHGDLTAADVVLQRRVDGVEGATKAINERLDRNDTTAATRHAEILRALRERRRSRWGSGDE